MDIYLAYKQITIASFSEQNIMSWTYILVLPLDPCHRLDVLVYHLELGATPLLRKKVDLALVVLVVAHLLSP
jgi:hypothetical protein